MFHTVNGVQIREHDETLMKPNTLEKRFEIEYLDNVYLHKLICIDLINLNVKKPRRFINKSLGRKWLYVIKDHDFDENREKYGVLCRMIHEKIGDYLRDEYGFEPTGLFLIDSMERVYVQI
ncbi:hypothetical protein AM500_03035 [Bacillus sp. FJAT-18017]|uniref:hypothetical protein n=1 Tax=Bacillus sp. FJAT-18017 TaxID=1705566 RepID=UPI0006AFFED9|nr:hypothetical protein [Bacillus sp. FJAT-18017]ALC88888.1 hypothetical protein AM500_03035 [Bacillus sp. FJAT-18017]